MRSSRLVILATTMILVASSPAYAWDFGSFIDSFYNHANDFANLMSKTHTAINATNYAMFEVGALPTNVQGMVKMSKQALTSLWTGTGELITGRPVSASLPKDATSQAFLNAGVKNVNGILGALADLNGNRQLGPQFQAAAASLNIDLTTDEGKAQFRQVMVDVARNYQNSGATRQWDFAAVNGWTQDGYSSSNGDGISRLLDQYELGGSSVVGNKVVGTFRFTPGAYAFVGDTVQVEAFFGMAETPLTPKDTPTGATILGTGQGYLYFSVTCDTPGQFPLSFHATDPSGNLYTVVSTIPLTVRSKASTGGAQAGTPTGSAASGGGETVRGTVTAGIDAAEARWKAGKASITDLQALEKAGKLPAESIAYLRKMEAGQTPGSALKAPQPAPQPSQTAKPPAPQQTHPPQPLAPKTSTTSIYDQDPQLKKLHDQRNVAANKADRLDAAVKAKAAEVNAQIKKGDQELIQGKTDAWSWGLKKQALQNELRTQQDQAKAARADAVKLDHQLDDAVVKAVAQGKVKPQGPEVYKAFTGPADTSALIDRVNQLQRQNAAGLGSFMPWN